MRQRHVCNHGERNEPTTIDGLVRRAVDARPNEEALADAPNRATLDGGLPQRLTWTEVDARIDGAVAELRAAGVGLGDSVRVQLASVVKLPITLLAYFRMGAVAAPDADPPSLSDLIAHLRDHEIASYKLPERLELIDALARNHVGKVVKPALRDLWSRQP